MQNTQRFLVLLVLLSQFATSAQTPILHVSSIHTGGLSTGFIPFTPYIYSSGYDNTVRIWDSNRGVELVKLPVNGTKDVAVSRDGKRLAILGVKNISVFLIDKNKLIEFGKDSAGTSISFSDDQRIHVLKKNEVDEWDYSGKKLKSFRYKFHFYNSLVDDVELRTFLIPGGTNILARYFHTGVINIENYRTGKHKSFPSEARTEGTFAISSDGKYLSFYENKRIHTIELVNYTEVSSIAVEPPDNVTIDEDAKRVMVAYKEKGIIRAWDLVTGIEQPAFNAKIRNVSLAKYGSSSSMSAKSTGEFLAQGYSSFPASSAIWLKDKAGERLIGLDAPRIFTQIHVLSGQHPGLVYKIGSGAYVFDLKRSVCRQIGATDTLGSIVKGITTYRSDKGFDRSNDTTKVLLFKYGNGNTIEATRTFQNVVVTDDTIPLLVSTNLKITDSHGSLIGSYAPRVFGWAAIGSGSRLLMSNQTKIDLIDLGLNKVIKSFGNCAVGSLLVPTTENKFVYSCGEYIKFNYVQRDFLVDIDSGNEWELKNFAWNGINFFGRDEVFYATPQNNILRKDYRSGKIIKEFRGHEKSVNSIEFLNDSIFVSGTSDGEVKFWNMKSGKELAGLRILDDENWVVTTPEGLFDATPGAINKKGSSAWMYYVVTDTSDKHQPYKVVNINQLKQRYYQPGLLSIKLGFSKEPLRVVPSLGKLDFAPEIRLSVLNDDLLIDLEDKGGGIGKISVYAEGSELLEDARPSNLTLNGGRGQIKLDLKKYSKRLIEGQPNKIKVVAWNKEEWLSSEAASIDYTPIPIKSKGVDVEVKEAEKKIVSLYAVVAGTSDYSGEKIDLKFASKDAQDFHQALKNSAEKLFQDKKPEIHLFTTDQPQGPLFPSKQNIVAVLKSLTKTEPQDVLILYLSGHGVNYGGQDGDFYYLTYQCSGADANYLKDPVARENYTLSSKELTQLLNDIPARKKVLILDACASGRAAEVMVTTTRDVPASQVRSLDRLSERTGFYVLSGSAADAVSYETSIYGQGLLTYSLLKAIKGAALRVDGGEEYVDIQKLLQYSVDEVPNLARGIGGIQQPLFRSPDNQRSYDIGKVTKEVKDLIKLAEPKPIFISSNFQDEDEMIDKINFSDRVNAQLRDITAKGRQAELVFTEGKEYPDAFRLTGRYKQEGVKILITFNVSKNNKKVAGPFTVQGDSNHLDAVVTALLKEASRNLK